MNYHEDEFIALVDVIEREGGQLLPDKCKSHKIRYQKSPKTPTDYVDVDSSGCGNLSRFVVTYDPGEQVSLPDMSELDCTIKNSNEGIRRVEIVQARPPIKSAEVAVDDLQAQRKRGAGLLAVCAVDDSIGAWPRYRDAIRREDNDDA